MNQAYAARRHPSRFDLIRSRLNLSSSACRQIARANCNAGSDENLYRGLGHVALKPFEPAFRAKSRFVMTADRLDTLIIGSKALEARGGRRIL
jgi:hypothetical protein